MPVTARPFRFDDVARLLGLAFGAAFGSFLLMLALLAATMATRSIFFVGWIGCLLLAHGWFIALIADYGLRLRLGSGAPSLHESMGVALRASVPLSVPLAVAMLIVWYTGDLRWSLVGWLVPVATALPARLVCRSRGERAAFRSTGVRAALAIPALALIELPGWPIQSCTGECWGFMEGGIVALPLLGAYLFLASTTAALLPVLAVRGVAPVRRDA